MIRLNSMEDFKRDINYHVCRDGGQVILKANLNDRFHDIRLELIVDLESLKIITAVADFIRNPSEDCPAVAGRMDNMVGFVIGRGLNRKLQEVFGGCEGCGNIRSMLQGLLPLAINVRAAGGFSDEQAMLASIKSQLGGSCAGYRERTL